jgi:uncharacterized membrane protein
MAFIKAGYRLRVYTNSWLLCLLHFGSSKITLLKSFLFDFQIMGKSQMSSTNMKTSHSPQAVQGNYDGSSWSWHLKRNISISPSQLALIFGALGLVSLIIGFAFYWVGASLILPFSLVEIAVLLVAYIYNAIHANDYETLTLNGNVIQVESKIGLKLNHMQFVSSLTRVDTLDHMNQLIQLKQGQKDTYFGRYVHANLRPLLAKQISSRLLSNHSY